MTFRLGKQKFAKNDQDSQILSITFCNMYFSKKGIRSVQWGGIFENFFVLKVTLYGL